MDTPNPQPTADQTPSQEVPVNPESGPSTNDSKKTLKFALIGLITVLFAMIGWLVWGAVDDSNKALDEANQQSETHISADETETEATLLPEGYIEYTNDDIGVSFAYPEEWGTVELTSQTGEQGTELNGQIGEMAQFSAFTSDYMPPGTDAELIIYARDGYTQSSGTYSLKSLVDNCLGCDPIANNRQNFAAITTKSGEAIVFTEHVAPGDSETPNTAMAVINLNGNYAAMGFDFIPPSGLSLEEEHAILKTILSTFHND